MVMYMRDYSVYMGRYCDGIGKNKFGVSHGI